jgi:hypothetical protein
VLHADCQGFKNLRLLMGEVVLANGMGKFYRVAGLPDIHDKKR